MDANDIELYLEKGMLVSPDAEDDLFTRTEVPAVAPAKVVVKQNYQEKSGARRVDDFIKYFSLRFKAVEGILCRREELRSATAIRRIITKRTKEQVAFIGMVREKSVTKNKNILLTMEDTTGALTLIVHHTKSKAYDVAQTVCLDEVLGVVGTYDGVVYAENILVPDVPLNKEFKKSPVDEAMVVIGDLHVGAKTFMGKEFAKFVQWLQGKVGNDEQKALARQVKYVFIVGDLVEGVGVYPNQEQDLELTDVYKQYALLAEYLHEIPEHISIIICPGNHDVGRLAEPQPKLFKDFAKPLYDLPNIISVSNPAYVTIGATTTFPGFDVLMYHGGSLIYYSEAIPDIRAAGGMKRADLIMKYLLQRRHLAPTHESTVYVPDTERDPLAIDVVPDFFITGHIHYAIISTYRNVTLINGSGWIPNTPYQDKRGIEPVLGRVIAVNLKTRDVRTLNFMSKEGV